MPQFTMYSKILNRPSFLKMLSFICAISTNICGADEPPAKTISSPTPTPSTVSTDSQSTKLGSSVATHLGLKFEPKTQEATNTYLDPKILDSIFPETVVLPKFVVRDRRQKFTEDQILTDKAKLARAEKSYLSPLYRVSFGPLSQLASYYFDWTSILNGWHPNEIEAMALYRENELQKRKAEMDRFIKLEAIGKGNDAKLLPELRLEKPANGMFIHLSD